MLYFQEKRLLQKIIDAYRYRPDVELKKISHYPGNTEILEKVVGEPVDSIQAHFASWMRNRFGINILTNIREEYIERLPSLFESCENLYTVMMDKGLERGMINKFQANLQELQRIYYTQWFQKKKEDEASFYNAEKQLRQGFTSEYINSDSYKSFKKLYDEVVELQHQMREAVFN